MNEQVWQLIEELSASSELNRLPEQYGSGRIFSKPLIGVSRSDDPIFEKFKEVVAPEHLTPAEMWVQSGLPDASDLAARLRIVSIILPYVSRIREESKDVERVPAEIYCVGRNYAEAFKTEVVDRTVKFFEDQGHRAVAGMKSPAFGILFKQDPPTIYSTWSERHMAFAAGLGTFSLHEGLITEAGCNMRVTSVITDAPLEVTPRKSDEPYANCLYYAKGTCRECEKRCPGEAITEEGHDKMKCGTCVRQIEREMVERLGSILKPHYRKVNDQDTTSYPLGCAFCQFGVPCTDRNPMAAAQEKAQA